MKRSMMQVYVKNSAEALTFYQWAFDAKVLCVYPNDDGALMHSELDIEGQIFAISEQLDSESLPGNTMQFCLHYGEGREATVKKAYEILKAEAQIICPLQPCDFSPLMAALIDKYGVYWCIFL